MFVGISISLVGKLRAGVSAYAIGSLEPPLVLDFEQEYYRTGGSDSTFSDSITHVRDGNGTMHDGTALKWAPHNLVSYSGDLTGADWNFINTASAADAETVTLGSDGYFESGSFTPVQGATYTIEVDLSSSTDDGELVDFGASMVGQTNSFRPAITLTTTPTVYSHEVTVTTATTFGVRVRNTDTLDKTFRATNFRIYRSDLGGMVDNPDTGNSYVPTTSSARYLPRRGHHVYNGAEWVNEGVLVEPSAATNLITYSEDFTDASWIPNGDTSPFTAPDATGPDGKTSAFTMVDNGAGGTGSNLDVFQAVTVATNTAYTASIFAKADQISFLYIRASGFTTPSNGNVWFDLGNGIVGTEQSTLSGTIEDYGNGWYRCAVTFTTDVADTSGLLQFGASEADASESVDLDGTSSILIYGAQFEAGSTPSSYIPTSGSTVTRAADTLTVPSANLPWPTPNVIGPELVTNGTFDTDTSGWTALRSTLTSPSGVLRITEDGVNPAGYARQTITTEVGKVYQIKADMTAISGATKGQVWVGTSAFAADLLLIDSITIPQTVTGVFVASSTTTVIELVQNAIAGGTTDFTDWDNISVREIDPLAVSIQMEGRQTYVDDNAPANNTFLAWPDTTSSNYIWLFGDSDRGTGGVTFRQRALGVLDTVEDSGSSYSPGINVPFNIASRHGSTFINGAVDGTALTADTTPTALPDLSTADLNLANSGGPMILKKVRIWSDDLGDSGIAEAST